MAVFLGLWREDFQRIWQQCSVNKAFQLSSYYCSISSFSLLEKCGIFTVQDDWRWLSICPCSVRLHPGKPWGRHEENVFSAVCSNRQGMLVRTCALKLVYFQQCYWDWLAKYCVEWDPVANTSHSDCCLKILLSSTAKLKYKQVFRQSTLLIRWCL